MTIGRICQRAARASIVSGGISIAPRAVASLIIFRLFLLKKR